jgi:glutathione S-transferase
LYPPPFPALTCSFGPLFNPTTSEEGKAAALVVLHSKLAILEGELKARETLVAGSLTVPDLYLFVQLGWLKYFGITLTPAYPNLAAFHARVSANPAVIKVIEAEGH